MHDTGESGALVLAGAVAKGAFEAGVSRELAARGLRFDRFVGASAGALNATLLAAGAAAGRFGEAAEKLEELWRDQAGITSFFAPTLAVHRGLSSTRRVSELVHAALKDIVEARPRAVPRTKLTLVTTNLRGVLYEGELTHEDEYTYDADALLDHEKWPEIASRAAASAAFPGLFVPPVFEDGDQRVDGGVVNNAPISYAIDESSTSNRIIVVSAEPASVPPRMKLGLVRLLPKLTEILINERIGRDLTVARSRNERRDAMLAALAHEGIPQARSSALADLLGLRELEILTIRPEAALAGGTFGGFFWRPWRTKQIEEGKLAAGDALRSPEGRHWLTGSSAARTRADGSAIFDTFRG